MRDRLEHLSREWPSTQDRSLDRRLTDVPEFSSRHGLGLAACGCHYPGRTARGDERTEIVGVGCAPRKGRGRLSLLWIMMMALGGKCLGRSALEGLCAATA